MVLTSPNIAQTATSAVVEKAKTYAERWSDHAPVTVTFDWDIAAVPGPRGPVEDVAIVE
jgi:exodeoxyribonuclease-3